MPFAYWDFEIPPTHRAWELFGAFMVVSVSGLFHVHRSGQFCCAGLDKRLRTALYDIQAMERVIELVY